MGGRFGASPAVRETVLHSSARGFAAWAIQRLAILPTAASPACASRRPVAASLEARARRDAPISHEEPLQDGDAMRVATSPLTVAVFSLFVNVLMLTLPIYLFQISIAC